MGNVFASVYASGLARKTLMWALQRDLGDWHSQGSPVLLRFCIKQPRDVHRV